MIKVRKVTSFALSMMFFMLSQIIVQPLYAFELSGFSVGAAEPQEIVSVQTQLATFNNATPIEVIVNLREGAVLTEMARLSPQAVVPNSAIIFAVPTLPADQYEITVEIDGSLNDPTDPPVRLGLAFYISNARSFNFNVVDWLPAGLADRTTKDVDFGDLDNDGDLDIYAFNSSNGNFVDQLLSNQGLSTGGVLGQFEDNSAGLPPIPAGAAGDAFEAGFRRTYDGDLVDVDGDGFKDVFRSDRNGVHLFINQGDGTFVNSPSLLPSNDEILNGTGISGFDGIGGVIDFDGIATADIDNDGDLDAILANYLNEDENDERGESLLLVNRLNTPDNQFVIDNRDGDVWDDISDDMTHGAVFGDVDGDGDPDLFLTNVSDGQKNRLLINQGSFSGDFIDETDARLPVAAVSDRRSVDGVFEDFDGDGDIDLYVVDRRDDNNLFWNDGSGVFSDLGAPNMPDQPDPDDQTYDVVAVDIDFDGDLDIIDGPGELGGVEQEARVLINRGGTDANMQFSLRTGSYLPSAQHRLTVDTGDVDFDLDIDLITGGGGGMTLYENDLFDASSEDMDMVFMIDRTRSMINGHDYFTPVKNAAKAILSQKRADDRVSIVTYDYTGAATDPIDADPAAQDSFKAQTILSLADSAGLGIGDIETLINDVDIGSCTMSRCTSIGQALRQGLAELKPNQDPERIKMLVVLTDGRQNLLPDVETVISEIVGGFPGNVRVYVIALGTNTDNQALSDISSLGSGFHQSPQVLDLVDITNNIEADASQKQLIPTTIRSRTGSQVDLSGFLDAQVISFDEQEVGTSISQQYFKKGVTFLNNGVSIVPRIISIGDSHALLNGPEKLSNGGDGIAANVAALSSVSIDAKNKHDSGPLTVYFSKQQQRVGMTLAALPITVKAELIAYDAYGVKIASATTGLAAGQSRFLGLESSAGDIQKVTLTYSGRLEHEVVDDVRFVAGQSMSQKRTFFVGAEDKQLRIGLTWQTPGIVTDVTLISPSGQVVTPAPGTAVEIFEGDVFRVLNLKGPEVGVWEIKTSAPAAELTRLAIMASSNLKLAVAPTRHLWEVGQAMRVNVFVGVERDGKLNTLSDAKLSVSVVTPTGRVSNSSQINQLPDGRFNVNFSDTALTGTYDFRITATLDAGTPHARSRTRRLSLVARTVRDSDVCDRNSKISAQPSVVSVDSEEKIRIDAYLFNCNGKPFELDQVPVNFWVSGGELIGKAVRIAPGRYQQEMTVPSTPGILRTQPIVGLRKLDVSAQVLVRPGKVDPRRTILILDTSPGFVHADGITKAGVSLIPVDVRGNRLGTGHDVQCDWLGHGLGDWIGPVTVDAAGRYSRVFTSQKQSGAAAIACHVNGVYIDPPLVVNFYEEEGEVEDLDGDGIPSWNDNCPFVSNAAQKDSNANHVGDICEPSLPNDLTESNEADNVLIIWLCVILLFCIFLLLLLLLRLTYSKN